MPCLFHCCIIGTTDVVCPLKYLYTSSCSSQFYLSTELYPWCLGSLFLAKAFQYSHMKKIWKSEEKLEHPQSPKNHLLEMCIILYCKDKEGERLHHTQEGTTKAVNSCGMGFFPSLQNYFNLFKLIHHWKMNHTGCDVSFCDLTKAATCTMLAFILKQHWHTFRISFCVICILKH